MANDTALAGDTVLAGNPVLAGDTVQAGNPVPADDGHAPGTDHNGLTVLSREESLRLLATAHIGRVGLSAAALPVVLPVNFAVDGDEIAIRTAPGTKLDAALRNAVVAFEVDDFDPIYHTGWSVMVTGMARQLTSPEELRRAQALPLRAWAPGVHDSFIAIPAQLVSGRRIAAP